MAAAISPVQIGEVKQMKPITIALMIGLVGAAMLGMIGCKTSQPVARDSQVARYSCPMHPDFVQATPGTCPTCGQTLVETINTLSSTAR